MAMIFSSLAVAAAALFESEAVPGPAAKGLEAGAWAVWDEDGAKAELRVLASSVGAEVGGDLAGDSVAGGLGVAAIGASAGEGAFVREWDFAIEPEHINAKAKAKMSIALNRAILIARCWLPRIIV